jgi:anti-sigma regulatory factor (Ser/Thr protein kinase)
MKSTRLWQTDEVGRYIIDNVSAHPKDIVALTTQKFELSRQTIHRHLSDLRRRGIIELTGVKRGARYALRDLSNHQVVVPIAAGTNEHAVWRETIAPHLGAWIASNVLEICEYGFTEMFNNVVDHSESPEACLSVITTAANIHLFVDDRGVGIFNKIQRDRGLEDPRHAVLELSKGKFTTDPTRHTGEGIFFSSRMFDGFCILSGGLALMHNADADWLLESKGDGPPMPGTVVSMEIRPLATRTRQEVFSHFSTDADGYDFSRTRVPVELARYEGESLISRSQAKRLLARGDKFKHIFLNFAGVQTIGPAFADEIFRVFANAHPEVRLDAVNTSAEVEAMIARACEAKTDGVDTSS